MKASLSVFVFCVLSLNNTDANLDVKPDNRTQVELGETFTAACRGSNVRNAIWFYGNKPISEGIHFPSNEISKLEIQMINFTNQGRYSCRLDEMEDSVTLYVYKRPTFPNLNESQTLTAGHVGRITCEINSVNDTFPHLYEWKKDRTNIKESERINIEGGKYLEIRNVTRNDEGMYECSVTVSYIDKVVVTRRNIEVFVTGDTTTHQPTTTIEKDTTTHQPTTIIEKGSYQSENSSQVHTAFYGSLLSVVFALIMSA